MPNYLKGTQEEFIEFKPRSYICKRALLPNRIDGDLDKAFWAEADWSEEFEDIEWDKKPKPYHKTRMKMLWDDNYLYIGAYLEEDKIWANLTERDSVIFYDNDFEVFIDPDGDTHNYFEFEINALNTVWDLLLTKPYRDNPKVINCWDIKGLKTAVKIDGYLNDSSKISQNKGWSVEIAMPFEVLKECNFEPRPPKAGEYWRIDFSRVEWQTEIINGEYKKVINTATGKPYPEDNWIWSPIGRVDMHMPELWGFLYFSDNENTSFEISEDEKRKWQLRRLYYMQRYYFKENFKYAECFEMLCDEKPIIMPQIQTTKTMYEAWLPTADTKGRVVINNEGRCYIEY